MRSILANPTPYLDEAFADAVERFLPERFRPFMTSDLGEVVLDLARRFHALGALNAAALVRAELGRPGDRRSCQSPCAEAILTQAERIIAQLCPGFDSTSTNH